MEESKEKLNFSILKKEMKTKIKKKKKTKENNEKAKNAEKQPRKPKQEKIIVRNTNSVFGAALAEALKGKDNFVTSDSVATETKASQNTFVGTLEQKVKDKKKLAEELGIGEITLTDILKELQKPARDPREDMPAPILRSDILEMKDLKKGMILKGTVRNVIDFGVFVDIGVHQDGLVHISQITNKYIKHPLEAVSVGDVVDVQILDVDVNKKRISLTMKITKLSN